MPGKNASDLTVKRFADGADLGAMRRVYEEGLVQGFTTNPTLMRKAGVTDYESFARQALAAFPHSPISFEVFSDDFAEMDSQARKIDSWGENVYVKVPITNTAGVSSASLARSLARDGIKLNITAILTLKQVETALDNLTSGVPSIISVFAGRIADTGVDPIPIMCQAVEACRKVAGAELLWASSREVLNVYQANDIGCDIITMTPDLLGKLKLRSRDLTETSLDTVKMFYDDGRAAGFTL